MYTVVLSRTGSTELANTIPKGNAMKRPTIADVAKRAGVSRSTVSYALSNKRSISNETRQRIQQAIEELGYSPNLVAQRLASGATGKNIGFVLPLVAPEITGLELKYIASAAAVINQADYNFVLLAHADRSPENLMRFAQSGLVDGFILLEVYMHDVRVNYLQSAGIPFVLIGRCEDNENLVYVDVDVDYSMKQSFDYLISLGHKSIAYLYRKDDDYGFTVRSLQGYRNVCDHYNIAPRTYPCALSPNDGQKAMSALLEEYPDVSAAIIWSDIPTLGAVQAIQDLGKSMPDDFSIICQEHSIISELTSFSPAIIDIRADEMAAQAAQLMIDLLEGKDIAQQQILFPPKLVLGEK
jgi:DNA-binding LacI/PurR family transcriptional regulator